MLKTGKWSDLNPAAFMEELEEKFIDPPGEFRPVPWLCFNNKLSLEEVLKSVDLLFEQGIKAFFIFPIYGMEIEYLTDEWFDLVKKTVAHCEKIGMSVWIYDDYSWPAGNCGGKLILEHPEFNKRNVYCDSVEVAAGEKFSKEISGSLIGCSILSDGKLEKVNPEFIDNTLEWTNNTGKNANLVVSYYAPCKSPGANWIIANRGCLWQKDYGLTLEFIDWLNPDAIDCFIEMAYERYYNELKPYWKTVIKGFMCDEPGFFGIHYNEILHAEFEKRYAYKIEDNYEHLFIYINEKTFQVRADFHRLAGEMLAKNIQKVSNWCLERGVDFTGHYLGEESPGQEVASQGDSWHIRKNMEIPGMDLLAFDSNYHPVPMTEYLFKKRRYPESSLVLTAKTTTSTARYTGSCRAFAEAYGIAPCWVAPVDHAAHTHWLCAMGINFINDNALSVSFEDFRKRSTGGKHFTMPWWDWYKDFIEFAGRCSMMAAIGKMPVQIGMLYPILSAQCTYSHFNCRFAENYDSAIYQEINYIVQQTAGMLTRNNVAWEMVWEEHLKSGRIDDGMLEFADVRLSAIVIPGMYFIEEKVLDALEKFVNSGGSLIFIGMLPKRIIDGNNGSLETVSRMLELKNVHFIEFQSPDEWPVIRKDIIPLLEPFGDQDFELSGIDLENIMAVHRVQDGTDIFHFVNMSPEATKITVDITTKKIPWLWHPDDGRFYSVEMSEVNGRKRMRLNFAPWEGYFVVAGIDISDSSGRFPLRNLVGGTGVYHGYHIPPETRPLDEVNNFHALDNLWEFKIEKPNMKPLVPKVFIEKAAEFSGEELSAETQDAKWLKTRNSITPFTLNPLENEFFWVKTVFYADNIPRNLAIVVDNKNYAEIYCNGLILENASQTTLWDSCNIKYLLDGIAQNGRNVLIIKTKVSDYLHPGVRVHQYMENSVEPIVLTGDFGAYFKHGEVQLGAIPEKIYTGDWGLQGFSGYTGTATYCQEVELSPNGREIWLDLGKVNVGAEVFINGKFAGRRCWPPYHYKIDHLLEDGSNKIQITVKNTLNNLFENDGAYDCKCGQAPSGILGPAIICIL